MPALHNFVTVDPSAFLSDAERMKMIYSICQTVQKSFLTHAFISIQQFCWPFCRQTCVHHFTLLSHKVMWLVEHMCGVGSEVWSVW